VTRRDRGSASIWVLACAVLLLVITEITVLRSDAVLARHQAESGADLAALAAAGQIGVSDRICSSAAGIARRNGVELRRCVPTLAADGRSGQVVVEVAGTVSFPLIGARTVSASARAERLPGPDPGPP
jgi:secretion/DNA translocation related TadE-like protein